MRRIQVIGRTIHEFSSVGLNQSKEFHGFAVDKKNVFEIDGEAARFLFQCARSMSTLRRIGSVEHVCQARLFTHDSRRSNPIGVPSLPGVSFTEEC
jgi:hypothetical protein